MSNPKCGTDDSFSRNQTKERTKLLYEKIEKLDESVEIDSITAADPRLVVLQWSGFKRAEIRLYCNLTGVQIALDINHKGGVELFKCYGDDYPLFLNVLNFIEHCISQAEKAEHYKA